MPSHQTLLDSCGLPCYSSHVIKDSYRLCFHLLHLIKDSCRLQSLFSFYFSYCYAQLYDYNYFYFINGGRKRKDVSSNHENFLPFHNNYMIIIVFIS